MNENNKNKPFESMRELMLARINVIKKESNGFPKGTMQWDNFSTGVVKTHISDMNFSEMEDVDLLFLFERLIKRYYSQM